MKDQLVLKVVANLLTPFILMYALYVQLHGEYSPGGGFQAGVIFASAFILHCLINGLEKTLKVISIDMLRVIAGCGVLLYSGVGVATVLLGGNFLDYSMLSENAVSGQKLGILLIELGVGLTVFSVMLLIFFVFTQREE